MDDFKNPAFMFQTTDTELLVKSLNGEIDALDLIKKEMIQRGLDETGKWVGFEQSQIIWNN